MILFSVTQLPNSEKDGRWKVEASNIKTIRQEHVVNTIMVKLESCGN